MLLTDDGEVRLLRSYSLVFNGFAARLMKEEPEAVVRKPGFLLSFPEFVRDLHTSTWSSEFLGLSTLIPSPAVSRVEPGH